MLQSLSITNFQCHEQLEIHLDPYLTCIVGKSDSGKSAILRALRWCCTNKPAGDAFLQHGAKEVLVELHAEDHCILRRRSGTRNEYALAGQAFHALGTGGIPDAIVKILNIDENSFQLQHDAPFWFSLSPGQVSKNLNRIVSLDLIDRTLGNLSSEVRKAKTTVEISRERLQGARKQRDELSWVGEVNEKLKKLEEQEDHINKKQGRIGSLSLLLADVRKYAEVLRNAFRNKSIVEKVIDQGGKVLELQEKITCLEKLLKDIRIAAHNLFIAKQNAAIAKQEFSDAMGNQCPLCQQPLPR